MNQTELLQEAKIARSFAKAKYSEYKVGSALLCENGEVVHGCNVESKAYPTTMCAERVAIFSAISQGLTKFKSIAVITKDGATPCGSCRQVIYEYAGNIPVYIGDLDGNEYCIQMSELLPNPFL
jgi:cytidine deaminase